MLGYCLALKLSKKYSVYGCDIVNQDENKNLFHVSCFDLTDYKTLEEDIKNVNPDFIIHTAALINVDLCEENKELAIKINENVTKYLVDLADMVNSELCFISTDAVFNGEKNAPYDEKDSVSPVNFYGITKLNSERYVLEKKYLVLRTNIYGWNIQEKVSFAEWVYNSLIESVNIYMYDDLFYSPIYVSDFAVIIEKCLDVHLQGLYHAAGGTDCSKWEFADALADIFHLSKKNIKRCKFADATFKVRRSPNMRLNSQKLEAKLNMKIPTLIEGLTKFKNEGRLYGKV